MGFSLERGNLYQGENIETAKELFKEKRDRVLNNIIDNGKATQDPEEKERYRMMLGEKIKEGFIDREYLEKYGWDAEKILITKDIVDFLLPQFSELEKKSIEKEEKFKPIIKQIKETILKTENGKGPEIGSEEGMEKRLIPRFELLVKFLKENGIKNDRYLCYKGENETSMIRSESYIMLVIPDLDKMVFLCDEEGNATYIIHKAPTKDEFEKLMHDEKIEESERQPQFYYRMSKADLQDLKKEFGIVSCVRWNENKWLESVSDELTKDFNLNCDIQTMNNFLKKSRAQREKNTNVEYAPSDWLTRTELIRKIDISYTEKNIKKVQDFINSRLEINPKLAMQYRDVNGIVRAHYSPELFNDVVKEFTQIEYAPAGWLTKTALSEKINVESLTFQDFANECIATNSELARLYKDGSGILRIHYSPELIDIVTKKYAKYEYAPSNWLNITALINKVGMAYSTKNKEKVQAFIDKCVTDNPELSKQYRDVMGRVATHYSPELLALAIGEFAKYESAPHDWLTITELIKKSGVGYNGVNRGKIKVLAGDYTKENLQLGGVYKDGNGGSRMHYSPKLIEMIKLDLRK